MRRAAVLVNGVYNVAGLCFVGPMKKPRRKPALSTPTEPLSFRLPTKMKRDLERLAKKDGAVSLTSYAAKVLQAHIEGARK